MKKLVITLSLVLALAIAATVSLPALAEDLGDTTLTVTIGANIIEVVVDDSAADMGSPTPDVPGEATVVVSGGSNSETGITITLEDKRTAPVLKGYMDDGTNKLVNALGVQGPLEGTNWTDLTVNPVTLYQSIGAGAIDPALTVNFEQKIDYTDLAGTYSITVTFVGTVNTP